MDYYKIPQEFKDAHPLPEPFYWKDESKPSHPGISGWLDMSGRWLFWVEDEDNAGKNFIAHANSDSRMNPDILALPPFKSYEEAFHYGYTLIMLGLLQEK